MGWELFEHDAGLGIKATGFDPGETLDQASMALTCILTGESDPSALRDKGTDQLIDFYVHAPDLDELAMAFLQEMLWHRESEKIMWTDGKIAVTETEEGGLEAVARGSGTPFDPAVHAEGFDVEAVMYRDLQFNQGSNGWTLHVLLDI